VSSIRGILTGLFEVAYQIGSVIGFWINYGITQHVPATSSSSWRIPMAFQLVPAGILFIGGFFLHESPLWLMRKEKHEQAYQALEDLRHLPRNISMSRKILLRCETGLLKRPPLPPSTEMAPGPFSVVLWPSSLVRE
jgi:MFS family permease